MTPATQTPIQIRDGLQDVLKAKLERGVSATNLTDILNHIGKWIQYGVQDKDGNRYEASVSTILSATRNAFMAKMGLQEEDSSEHTLLKTSLERIEKAFSGEERSQSLSLALNMAIKPLDQITETLNSLEGLPAESKLTKDEQNALIQKLIIDAELDPENFVEGLTESLNKEKANLSQEGVRAIIEATQTLKAHASLFTSFDTTGGFVKFADTVAFQDDTQGQKYLKLFSEGKFEGNISAEDQEAVAKVLKDVQETYEKNVESKGEAKAASDARDLLIKNFAKLNDAQRAYFKHVAGTYTKLKESEPSEILTKLMKSIPNIVVPGVIGAVIAAIFGFSSTVGVGAAIAVSLLGGLGEKPKPPAPNYEVAA